MAEEQKEAAPPEAGAVRSKNYPAFGLKDAIVKARKSYEQDKRATVPADVAVKAWGYGGINGASLKTLGTMKQYALLEYPQPKYVRLSALALTLMLEPEDSPVYAEAILKASEAPAVFGELKAQYPEGLPSDAAVKSHLVRIANFGEDAADTVIASYRETMALAAEYRNADIADKETGRAEKDSAKNPARGSNGKGDRKMEATRTFTYTLPGNSVATLTIDGAVPSVDSVKLLTGFLALVQQSLQMEATQIAAAAALEAVPAGSGG